jgi:hypothetical protein
MLGQHSAEVFENRLGLSRREIEGLAADKVITLATVLGARPSPRTAACAAR